MTRQAVPPVGQPPEVVSVATLFDGFEQAFARWRAVERASAEPGETFIPLFEALEWTVSIQERLGLWEIWGDLRGLRWARNRAHHDWALALEVRAWDELVLRPSMVREPGPDEWAWRDCLPEAQPPRYRSDEPYYDEYLAGQPARVTLNLLRHLFLEELRRHYR